MSRHTALPISLYVDGRPVVVVGDGDSTGRRARRFEAAGAAVRRVSPADFDASACDGAFLVAFQEPVSGGVDIARAAGALVYVHDAPDVSDVAMPGLAQRGPVKIAISTDGAAPALTRRLRQQLQRLLDDADALDPLLADLEALRAALPPSDERTQKLNDLAATLELRGKLVVSRGLS